MTGLILHCKTFCFRDVANATKPAGITQTIAGRELSAGHYNSAVVVLSCVERGDTAPVVLQAAEHVEHMIRVWHKGNTNVVVLPFAHLSSAIGTPHTSLALLRVLITQLETYGNSVQFATFGSHKEWMVDVYGYPRAASWFQYRP